MHPTTSHPTQPDTAGERLSSLVDGQAGPQDWLAACNEWADSPACRERWHAYHLIGDTLRSQELPSAPGHDVAFLAALRLRLAEEPVVLSPAPLASPPAAATPRRLGWAAPAAVAAGFMAVAGVLVVLRQPAPEPAAVVAQRPAGTAGSAPLVVVNGQMIRNARLDRYLAAHRGPAQGASLTAPGVVVHGVVDLSSGDGQ